MISTKHDGIYGGEFWELPNGRLHREDGPAVTYSSGTTIWYYNGKRHREDGPAAMFISGTRHWWLNGRAYTLDNYCSMLKTHYGKTDEDVMMLRMQYDTD